MYISFLLHELIINSIHYYIALFHLIIVLSHDWLYRGNCVARYPQRKLLRSVMLRNSSLVTISRNFSRAFSFTLMQNNYIPRMLSRGKIRETFIPHSFLPVESFKQFKFFAINSPLNI